MTGVFEGLVEQVRSAFTVEANRRLAKMTETFLAEIGVLVAVFPVLDSFIATGHLSWRIIAYSFAVSLLFYVMAATLAIFIGE
jgi:hypothetical protein